MILYFALAALALLSVSVALVSVPPRPRLAADLPGYTSPAVASTAVRTQPRDPIMLVRPLSADPTEVDELWPDAGPTMWVWPVYQLPTAGRVQIDDEVIVYRAWYSDRGLNNGITSVHDLTRGWGGTPIQPHAADTPLVSLDSQMNWTFDDAAWCYYWEAGQETCIRLSDEVVFAWAGAAQIPTATATPTGGLSLSVSPVAASTGQNVTVAWLGFTAHDSDSYWAMFRLSDLNTGGSDCCNGFGLGADAVSGSHTVTLAADQAPDTYQMRLFNATGRVAVSNPFTVAAPTATPTPTLTPTPTATPTATPVPTPTLCAVVATAIPLRIEGPCS